MTPISSGRLSLVRSIPCALNATISFSIRSRQSHLMSLRGFSAASGVLSGLPPKRIEQAVTPEVAMQLDASGYAVVDRVFGDECATVFRSEIIDLHKAGRTHLNSTHLVRGQTTELLQKRGVYEAELCEPDVQAAAPLLSSLQNDSTLRTLLSVYLPHLTLTTQAIKAQVNEGGGACFPMHFDSDEALDGRRLSAIFYLNKGWQPAHGGQLQLYPFGAAPVDIAPLHDRLVMFASTRMLHRVMPSHAQRVCFTLWMSQVQSRCQMAAPPTALLREALELASAGGGVDVVAARKLLQHADIQKLATKLHYAEIWAASIKESHADSRERRMSLEQFWQDLEVTRRVLRPLEHVLRGAFPVKPAPLPYQI